MGCSVYAVSGVVGAVYVVGYRFSADARLMSGHAAFRRQPVPGEMALRHQTVTLPAPIRGIIETENWAYIKPGCANILDNWFPTQKGLKLRGGTERWAVLPDAGRDRALRA